jgi:hypothetical protein
MVAGLQLIQPEREMRLKHGSKPAGLDQQATLA